MSVATLDSQLQERKQGSSITIHPTAQQACVASRRGMRLSSTTHPMLWAFDEQEERLRFQGIQNRLIRLEAALFDEYGTRLDNGSRQCLFSLFVACPTVRAPLISAQPDGRVVATWRQVDGEELVVRCETADHYSYSLAMRSTVDGSLTNRQWGSGIGPSVFFAENQLAKRIAS